MSMLMMEERKPVLISIDVKGGPRIGVGEGWPHSFEEIKLNGEEIDQLQKIIRRFLKKIRISLEKQVGDKS